MGASNPISAMESASALTAVRDSARRDLPASMCERGIAAASIVGPQPWYGVPTSRTGADVSPTFNSLSVRPSANAFHAAAT
jgi:hypothetical protein